MELVTLQMNARSMVEWPVATVQRGTYLHKIGCTSLLSYSSMVCCGYVYKIGSISLIFNIPIVS